jgi:integrase
MARTKNKLTAAMVRQSKPGVYADGGGLYLQVTKGKDGKPKRSWFVRVRLPGNKVRGMGLGTVDRVDLARARERAEEARNLAFDGVDPIEHKAEEARQAAEAAARKITFRRAAENYIDAHEASWRNPVHRQQWRRTLEIYAYPVFGDLPVQSVDVPLVMKVLDPLWRTKTETGSRLRGRIETILDWAAVRGHRSGENPARWRGHLQRALPARSRVQKVKHHKALPYADLPAFMKRLRRNTSISARALEFTILTCVRTSETRMASWRQMDRIDGIWTVPADNTKSYRESRIPLGPRAHQIIADLDDLGLNDEWVFPNPKGTHLSRAAMYELLKGMGADATVHGMRSAFRDWAGAETVHQREVIEMAMSHLVGSKAERAYARDDLLEKRRLLTEDWDRYLSGKSSMNKATKRPSHTRFKQKADDGSAPN